jgi:hypothetical protein
MRRVLGHLALIEEDATDYCVVCVHCGEILDRVPSKRTAYCRVGIYGRHGCVGGEGEIEVEDGARNDG